MHIRDRFDCASNHDMPVGLTLAEATDLLAACGWRVVLCGSGHRMHRIGGQTFGDPDLLYGCHWLVIDLPPGYQTAIPKHLWRPRPHELAYDILKGGIA